MTIEELKKLKREYGYSAAKLSELSGVSLGTLTKILYGETRAPRSDTLEALERVFRERHSGDLHQYPEADKRSQYLCERAVSYGVQQKEQGTYTLADLEILPEGRYTELINGVLYDLASPTVNHQEIAQRVWLAAFRHISRKKGSCRAMLGPVDVYLDRDDRTCVIPDMFIVCDPEKLRKKGVYGAPDFILEVLSPATSRKDRFVKSVKYEEAGVREYWLIDPDAKRLIIYDYANTGIPQILPLQGNAQIGIFEEAVQVDLDELACLADEYGE